MNCGQLAVGDIIESVDGMPLASLSLDEIGDGLKGQPGSMITLYIHARGAHAETKKTREKKSNSETSLSVGLSQGSLVLSVQDPDNKGVVEEITVSMDQVYYKVRWNNGKLSDWLLAMEIARDTAQLADALVSMNSAERFAAIKQGGITAADLAAAMACCPLEKMLAIFRDLPDEIKTEVLAALPDNARLCGAEVAGCGGGPAPTEQLSADQAILGAAEDEKGRYRESDAGALRESADDMNDDLKQHLRQRHISRQGIENLLNAGVHHLSDLRYLDPPDIASLGMSLVDRKKLEKLVHELEENAHGS
jgi:hypothetical protein